MEVPVNLAPNFRAVPARPVGRGQIIVVGNEKGGAGKSTLAIHIGAALMHSGAKVAVIYLDLRQQSVGHFFASRRAWCDANGADLPMPVRMPLADEAKRLMKADEAEALAEFDGACTSAATLADFVIIDTPGSDTALSRAAHGRADLIITPMNDSFVDFDMLGTVDPVSLELVRPSVYAEAVWEARKKKMLAERRSLDWLVLRNRLATSEARNRKRLEERIEVLAKRVGFRVGPGMRDRVIYRELFPFGLTVADLSPAVRPAPVSLTHVAARQELRAVMTAAGLGDGAERKIAEHKTGATERAVPAA
jgi:chromosome partitioning protein